LTQSLVLMSTITPTLGSSWNSVWDHEGPGMASITGWYEPTTKGGALRSAAQSYLPGPRDPGVRLPGLRKGDLLTLQDGRVQSVNGLPPDQAAARPEFTKLGAVHPSRP